MTDLSSLDRANALNRISDNIALGRVEVLTYTLESPVETVGAEQLPTGYTTLHVVVRDPGLVEEFRRALLG